MLQIGISPGLYRFIFRRRITGAHQQAEKALPPFLTEMGGSYSATLITDGVLFTGSPIISALD
jgi:hypothetical protein